MFFHFICLNLQSAKATSCYHGSMDNYWIECPFNWVQTKAYKIWCWSEKKMKTMELSQFGYPTHVWVLWVLGKIQTQLFVGWLTLMCLCFCTFVVCAFVPLWTPYAKCDSIEAACLETDKINHIWCGLLDCQCSLEAVGSSCGSSWVKFSLVSNHCTQVPLLHVCVY